MPNATWWFVLVFATLAFRARGRRVVVRPFDEGTEPSSGAGRASQDFRDARDGECGRSPVARPERSVSRRSGKQENESTVALPRRRARRACPTAGPLAGSTNHCRFLFRDDRTGIQIQTLDNGSGVRQYVARLARALSAVSLELRRGAVDGREYACLMSVSTRFDGSSSWLVACRDQWLLSVGREELMVHRFRLQ
jgi:hypothetical protein